MGKRHAFHLGVTAAAVAFGFVAIAEAAPKGGLAKLDGGPGAQCKAEEGYAAAFGGRRTFFLKPDQLLGIKDRLESDPAVKDAYAALIRRANAALARPNPSVMDKTTIPLSNDRHDYLTLAPYWWPDPANPKGPYIRKDGEINPRRDTKSFDKVAINRFSNDVTALGLAYFYSGDARYAAKAAAMVRTWFLDPATLMNPNVNYGQAVPGRENGRAEGVLDTNLFQPVIDAIGLIGPSGELKAEELAGVERWFGRYVDWMLKSVNGKDEQAAKNNHGMWFDSQIAQFALFARRPDVATRTVLAFPDKRIAVQFAPDGKLPAELTRTRTLHYSVFALFAAYNVAEIGACLGHDLWNYADGAGRGLRRATDYVARYSGRIDAWPHQEIKPDQAEVDELTTRASWAWPAGSYRRATGRDLSLEYSGAP